MIFHRDYINLIDSVIEVCDGNTDFVYKTLHALMLPNIIIISILVHILIDELYPFDCYFR